MWCGTLKRVVWYVEEGDVILWRGWCVTLKRVVYYFEEGDVVLWNGWFITLKRVGCYFETGGLLLCRGWCDTLKVCFNTNFFMIIYIQSLYFYLWNAVLPLPDTIIDFFQIDYDFPGRMSAGLTCRVKITFKPQVNQVFI